MAKNFKPRLCKMCGREFKPNGPTQKYCVGCGKVKKRENNLKSALNYRKRHPEKRLEYYQANREKILKQQSEYRKANREKFLEYRRGYYAANREKILEQQSEYRKANREKLLEYSRKYYKANREKMLEYGREYRKAKRKKTAERDKEHSKANGGRLNGRQDGSRLKKAARCQFKGSCFECPYPDCVKD